MQKHHIIDLKFFKHEIIKLLCFSIKKFVRIAYNQYEPNQNIPEKKNNARSTE